MPVDVNEIANRLISHHESYGVERIEKLVNEKINGKEVPIENIGGEIMYMVAQLIGEVRAQDLKFTIDLVQSVVNEIEKN